MVEGTTVLHFHQIIYDDYRVQYTLCSKKTVLPVLLNVANRGKAVLNSHLKAEKHLEMIESNSASIPAITSKKLEVYFAPGDKARKT